MKNEFENKNWDDESIATLVNDARTGCGQSQNQLFNQLKNYLAYIANQNLDDHYQAKFGASDIVQQSFVQAIQGFNKYQGSTSAEFKGWLRMIAINEIKSLKRKFNSAKRKVHREQAISPDSQASGGTLELFDSFCTPASHMVEQEKTDVVMDAIGQLPELQQEVIKMRNWEDMTFSDIGEKLGVSAAKAAKLWYGALIKIEEAYKHKSH